MSHRTQAVAYWRRLARSSPLYGKAAVEVLERQLLTVRSEKKRMKLLAKIERLKGGS